jgi:hypothetical protein
MNVIIDYCIAVKRTINNVIIYRNKRRKQVVITTVKSTTDRFIGINRPIRVVI